MKEDEEVGQREEPPDGRDGTAPDVTFYVREARPPYRLTFIRKEDPATFLRYGIFAAGARLVGERAWPALSDGVPQRRSRSLRRRMEAGMRSYFGDEKSAADLREISAALRRDSNRRLMLTAIEAAGNWRPLFSLDGAGRLSEALADGRGAIVWIDMFSAYSLAGKRALFDAGFPAYHISTITHGNLASRLGYRLINARQQAGENRYLAERVPFDHGGEVTVMRRVVSLLRKNRLIMMTNNFYSGRRFIRLRVGVDAVTALPTAPLNLAANQEVPIFPFAVFETEPFVRYHGVIGERLRFDLVGPDDADDKDRALVGAALAYRSWLDPHLRRYPEQWMRWQAFAPRPAADEGADEGS